MMSIIRWPSLAAGRVACHRGAHAAGRRCRPRRSPDANAQSQSQPPDAITPVEEFSRQLEQFKNTIPQLNKQIEDSTAAVDRWTNVERARKEIEELRAIVGAALGAVSDNGVVSQLGATALAHAREKLRALRAGHALQAGGAAVPDRAVAAAAGRDRARHRRAGGRAQGIRRAVARRCRPTRTSSRSSCRSGRRRRRST